MASKSPLIHPARRQTPRGNVLRDRARSICDFRATPVIHAHHQIQSGVLMRFFFRALQSVNDRFPQFRLAPAPAHVHSPLVQQVRSPSQNITGVAHDEADLCRRALPVFRRESVDGKIAHSCVDGPGDRVEKRILPRPVPLGARKSPIVGPAPIAVHNDGDVARYFPGREFGCLSRPLPRSCDRLTWVFGRAIHGRQLREFRAHPCALLSRSCSDFKRRSICH